MTSKLTINSPVSVKKARSTVRQPRADVDVVTAMHGPAKSRLWARRWRETITYHPNRAAAIVMLMHDIAANPPRTAQEHADFARLRADINANPQLAAHAPRAGMRNGVPYTLHLQTLAVWRAAGAHGKY